MWFFSWRKTRVSPKRDTKGWQRQRKKADEKENEFLNKRNDAKSSWSKKEQENVCRDEEKNKKKRETVRKKGNKAEDEEEEKRSSFSIFFFDFSPSLLLFLSISFFTPSLSFFLYLSTSDELKARGSLSKKEGTVRSLHVLWSESLLASFFFILSLILPLLLEDLETVMSLLFEF